jgi:hypothetical protein
MGLHREIAPRRDVLRGRRRELVAAAITAAGKFVLADWLHLELLYLVSAVLFWVIYVASRVLADSDIVHRWGFQRAGLQEAAVLCGIALGIGGLFSIIYGTVADTALINPNLALILLLYPAWGLIQQFMLVAIFADNVMALSRGRASEFVVVMFAALTFSAIHFPEIPLMIATFFLGAATTLIFFRTRNMWLIGLLHGWFSSLFYFFVMGHDPLQPLLSIAFGGGG